MSNFFHRSRAEWEGILAEITVGHLKGRKPDEMYRSSIFTMRFFEEHAPLRDNDLVLDVGCGHGRLAIALTERDVRYLGIDPMKVCVEFGERAFLPWPHIRFEHLDIESERYNPAGSVSPLDVRFPVDSSVVDRVIFNSVFTHLERLEVCERYLRETMRVLKPGGMCWTTWFRSPPNEVDHSVGRTVLREADIIELVKPLRVLYTKAGLTAGENDQWILLLEKAT